MSEYKPRFQLMRSEWIDHKVEYEPHLTQRRYEQLAVVLGKEFDREIKQIRADAWDECDDAWEFAHRMSNLEPWEHLKDNPYREGQ